MTRSPARRPTAGTCLPRNGGVITLRSRLSRVGLGLPREVGAGPWRPPARPGHHRDRQPARMRGWQDLEAGMGLMVTIFIAVCAVIGWIRSRGRGGGLWWRLIRAIAWALGALAV